MVAGGPGSARELPWATISAVSARPDNLQWRTRRLLEAVHGDAGLPHRDDSPLCLDNIASPAQPPVLCRPAPTRPIAADPKKRAAAALDASCAVGENWTVLRRPRDGPLGQDMAARDLWLPGRDVLQLLRAESARSVQGPSAAADLEGELQRANRFVIRPDEPMSCPNLGSHVPPFVCLLCLSLYASGLLPPGVFSVPRVSSRHLPPMCCPPPGASYLPAVGVHDTCSPGLCGHRT